MFDYDGLSDEVIFEECQRLPIKLRRWIVANHPDNRSRKIILKTTNVEVGEGAVINCGFVVSDNYKWLLRIGARAAISPNVLVICASAPNNSELSKFKELHARIIVEQPVIIDDDSWIGAGAIILPGVHIGQGSIVGAGSVVVKNVPAWSCCAGVPAKITRKINQLDSQPSSEESRTSGN